MRDDHHRLAERSESQCLASYSGDWSAEIVGIPVIDHIVVGADKAISIQEWRSGNRW